MSLSVKIYNILVSRD